MKLVIFFLFGLIHLRSLGAGDTLPDVSFVELASGKMAYRAVRREAQDAGTIIYIHPNSASSRVFEKQLTSPLLTQRLFGLDLMGHGASEDAADPEHTYSFCGHAETVIDFMEKAGIKGPVILCGVSLGGHVAIEVARLRPDRVSGLFLSGSPPIDLTPEGFKAGFKPFDAVSLMKKEKAFTREEAQKFIGMVWPDPPEAWIQEAMRTDGRARSFMIAQASSGQGISQRETVTRTSIPVAFVIGTLDPGINGDYIEGLAYATPPIIHKIPCGHDTFFAPHEQFNGWLNDFALHCPHKA